MDVHKLQYFTEVIERGSIGKAATALRVSQPALTKSLRLLEAELDVKLVERLPTGVLPTEYGRSLYAHAKSVLAELAHARTEIAQLKGEETRYVRLASLPSIAVLVARSVAQSLRNNLDLQVRAVEMQHYQLLPALRRGDVDFVIGLGDNPEIEKGIRARILGHDRLRFTVRTGHRLARMAAPALAHLVTYPWVFPIVGTSDFSHAMRQLFNEAGLKPAIPHVEAGSMQFVKSLILESDCVGILSEHVTDLERRSGQLAALPIESPLLTRTITLYELSAKPASRAAREMMSNVERTFREWERSHPVPMPPARP